MLVQYDLVTLGATILGGKCQVVHNFVQGTQFKVQPSVCKRGQVSHIQKLIIAFVPVYSDQLTCKLLRAFE